MRNVRDLAAMIIGASALAACSPDASDQNIMVDNNMAAEADIEAVPADESSATPSDELANGAVEENSATSNLGNSF